MKAQEAKSPGLGWGWAFLDALRMLRLILSLASTGFLFFLLEEKDGMRFYQALPAGALRCVFYVGLNLIKRIFAQGELGCCHGLT